MNLAFPALIVIVLILPGAIFRYSYARGSWGWTSPTSFRSISDELAYSAVVAVVLHLVALVAVWPFGYYADFRALVALLIGNFGAHGEHYERSVSALADHPIEIATYFLGQVSCAAALGNIAHRIVRGTKLDLRTRMFRFKNEWHYLLTGEVLCFEEVSIEEREIDAVYLSAIVEQGKDCYLYRGLVEDWSFDKDGQLDTIRLGLAHRRRLDSDRRDYAVFETGAAVPPDERYYEIRGDLFVLRYSQIKNINLDYLSLSEDQGPFKELSPENTGVAE